MSKPLSIVYWTLSVILVFSSPVRAQVKMDSLAFYRNIKDWDRFHNEVNKLVVSDSAILNDKNIIELISNQSNLLKKEKQYIEAGYIWNYAGKLYAINGDFQNALPYYEKAINELSLNNDSTYLHLIHYYHSQAIILGVNDPAKALESSTEAFRLYKNRNDVNPRILGKLHYAQGWAYRGLKQFDKAIESFSKSIELSKDEDGYVETFLCRTYLEMGNYEKALESAEIANTKYERLYHKPNNEYVLLIGRSKSGLNQHKEAESLLNKSIEIGKSHYPKYHTEFIKLYYFLAKIQFNADKKGEARSSIETLFKLSFPELNEDPNYLHQIQSPFPNLWALDGLILNGQILLAQYTESNDIDHLVLALDCFDKSIEEVHSRRAELTSWKSKQEFNNYGFDAFEGAIASTYYLYKKTNEISYLNKMIQYIEGSRSILLKSYQQELAYQDAVISEDNKQKIAKLKKEIAEIEKAYYSAVDSEKIKDAELLNKQLLDKRKEWMSLIRPYSESNNYQKLNQDQHQISINTLQNHLSDSDAILMYYELSDKILTVCVSKDHFSVKEIQHSKDFTSAVIDLYKSLSDWNMIHGEYNKASESFTINSRKLSQLLLSEIDTVIKDVKKLIVIPDGSLYSLPFEVLMFDEEMLLNKVSIQYVLSCDQLFKSRLHSIESPYLFGGFAPIYKEVNINDPDPYVLEDNTSKSLVDLPGTRKTVTRLSNKFNGTVWLGEDATKENFTQHASDFSILHLGMHGVIHNKESNLSKLYFGNEEKNTLSVGEIQSMALTSEMVVLSACETNVGILKDGEGPLSLAYAFMYAGSKSVLSSLWSVPDGPSSQIMVSFYDYLDQGYAKSKALQNAKLDYLKSAVGVERHPSFWAGFIIIGSDSPVVSNHSPWQIYLSISLILLFIVLAYFWRRKGLKN